MYLFAVSVILRILQSFLAYLVLSVATFLMLHMALAYSSFKPDINFLQYKQDYIHHPDSCKERRYCSTQTLYDQELRTDIFCHHITLMEDRTGLFIPSRSADPVYDPGMDRICAQSTIGRVADL